MKKIFLTHLLLGFMLFSVTSTATSAMPSKIKISKNEHKVNVTADVASSYCTCVDIKLPEKMDLKKKPQGPNEYEGSIKIDVNQTGRVYNELKFNVSVLGPANLYNNAAQKTSHFTHFDAKIKNNINTVKIYDTSAVASLGSKEVTFKKGETFDLVVNAFLKTDATQQDRNNGTVHSGELSLKFDIVV